MFSLGHCELKIVQVFVPNGVGIPFVSTKIILDFYKNIVTKSSIISNVK